MSSVADESRFSHEANKKYTPAITKEVLKWWDSLSQHQKQQYCAIYPKSELTLGHTTDHIWDGWDKAKMKQYHQRQAADIKVNLLGANDAEKVKLERLLKQQTKLAE